MKCHKPLNWVLLQETMTHLCVLTQHFLGMCLHYIQEQPLIFSTEREYQTMLPRRLYPMHVSIRNNVLLPLCCHKLYNGFRACTGPELDQIICGVWPHLQTTLKKFYRGPSKPTQHRPRTKAAVQSVTAHLGKERCGWVSHKSAHREPKLKWNL